MKTSAFLLILIFFFSTSFVDNTSVGPNPKHLGRAVFNALRNQNYKAYERVIFEESDCEYLFTEMELPQELKDSSIAQCQELTKRIHGIAKDNFQEIITKGKARDIVWSKVKLKEVRFDVSIYDFQTDIYLQCEYRETKFRVKLNNCVKARQWLIRDEMELKFGE